MEEVQTPENGMEQQVVAPETATETETPEIPSEEVEISPEQPTEPQEPPQPTEPDYKQKFVDSQREAILLAERNKIKESQLEKLTKTDTPTGEAMRQLYPDWDDYNDVTKKAFIRQEAQEMRQRRIERELTELREEKQLQNELDSVISENPKFHGKESDFNRFAMNPKNKGISADVLAKAFLFDVEETPAQTEVSKTEALPAGNGGPREPLKPKKISLEEASEIRKNDYNRYLELVKTGQIAFWTYLFSRINKSNSFMPNLQSRYHKEKTSRLLWQNKRRVENRAKYWEWLSQHSCVECGETDIVVLEADHIERTENRRKAISLLVGSNRSWEYILKELEKCRVLCANCHRKHTAKQLGYGKLQYKSRLNSSTL